MKKQKTEKLKTNKGITLIALVITIIVMLILVAVTISMAVNGGLFNYAGNAVGGTNNAIKAEQDLGSGKITIDNKVYNSIDEYLNGGETEDSTLKPMVLKLNVQEGDTVNLGIYRDTYGVEDAEGNLIEIELPDTDVTIDWGDGEVEHYTSSNLNKEENSYLDANHEYSETNDDVTVTITGKCNIIDFRVAGLTAIEAWGNTETYYYYFGESNLVSIAAPEKNTFKNVISFESTFSHCENLTSIPENLFANCPNVKSFRSTFADCTSLSGLPANMFTNCTLVTDFSHTFSNCTSLTNLPDNMFANCTSVTDFGSTFSYCTSLTSLPQNLFDDCQNVRTFECTFLSCENLTGEAIPLWERIQNPDEDGYGIPEGLSCYHGCEKLINYETMPLHWRESQE